MCISVTGNHLPIAFLNWFKIGSRFCIWGNDSIFCSQINCHIAQGHLAKNGFIGDGSINSSGKDDADENEADAYAIRLLNGSEVRYTTQGGALSPQELYSAAKRKSTEKNVDVGHIILNFGNAQKNIPLANMALRKVEGSDNGADVINQAFFSSLNQELLSDDQLQLLKTVTGYNVN